MTKFNYLPIVAAAIASALSFTSCSDDNEPGAGDNYQVITFENSGLTLAGPTSYGESLYSGADTRFTTGSIALKDGETFDFGINYGFSYSTYDNDYEFYNGGLVLSQWNIRSNSESAASDDWWYSYSNQCSVYNDASTDGAGLAGHNGSSTFAVIYGCNGSYSDSRASFSFSDGATHTIVKAYVCNASYTYGCIVNGNSISESLEKASGWFKIVAYGYDAAGELTGKTEKYLCDYSNNLPALTTWSEWDLSGLGKVNSVKFDFEGSDMGTYGLNTPTYACIDDITID